MKHNNDFIRLMICDGYNLYICSSINSFVNYYNKYNDEKVQWFHILKILKNGITDGDEFINFKDFKIKIIDDYDYYQEMKKDKQFVAPGVYIQYYC